MWGGPGVGRMCMMEGEGFWGVGGASGGGLHPVLWNIFAFSLFEH